MLFEAGTLNKPVFMLFKVRDVKPLSSWLKLGAERAQVHTQCVILINTLPF